MNSLSIEGTLISGGHYSTAALKGKVVLVAGWYEGCRLDLIPQFQGLLEKYHGQGLEILGLAYDANINSAKVALAAHPECKFPVLYQSANPDAALGCVALGKFRFGVDGTGGSMVIERKGVMHFIDQPLGLQQVDAQIAKFLAESP
jgi:hypothetical protein